MQQLLVRNLKSITDVVRKCSFLLAICSSQGSVGSSQKVLALFQCVAYFVLVMQ